MDATELLKRHVLPVILGTLSACLWFAGCSTDTAPEFPSSQLNNSSITPTAASPRQQVELRHQRSPKDRSGSQSTTTASSDPSKEFDVVTVFWGTNRKVAAARELTTAAFTADNARKLSTGFAHVTIPKIGRDAGTIQRPARYGVLGVTLYAERESPDKHFTIGELKALDTASFIAAAEITRANSRRFLDEAFVFVHGYNTDFEAAVFRTAQLAYDLEFDGVPYVFSWPSRGELKSYLYDRDASDSAQRYLLEFLSLIARQTNVQRIHLIAHSMGTRLLTETLKTVAADRSPARLPKIQQIVLAAPDIDAQVFEEIASAINGVGSGVTLYASSNDQALLTSRGAAMGRPRAGEVFSTGPTIAPGIDTIDITDAGFTSLWSLNHTTFSEKSHILKDIQLLLKSGTRPPDQRFPVYKRREVAAGGTYWQYVKN